jgi:HAMP domain-containing protein
VRSRPGQAVTSADGGGLVIPAISGPVPGHQAVTAAVVIGAGGTIVASSVPSRYPPGQPAEDALPPAAASAVVAKNFTGDVASSSTPGGRVSWALAGLPGGGPGPGSAGGKPGLASYLYVQAPQPTGWVNPVRAWDELRQLSGPGGLLWASYGLLIAIVPVGVVFGVLASRRLVRRVRRLEAATVAVSDGDYEVSLPLSGRDEVGGLEANFNTMTRQLGSALAAERERATSDARAAERARIAREIHDAISQHLFGLRMIAAAMRRANPGERASPGGRAHQ